jgi:hypothetical protein
MSQKTITYSTSGQGWTSFWSYFPDWMTGINNTFYTWNNGNLYKHNSNQTRNNFYGVQGQSEVTTILNTEPTTVKMFKTLALDSTDAWEAEITTDLNVGRVDPSQFIEKEGHLFAHIRRTYGDQDHKAISTQGIGECNFVDTGVITFGFNLDSSVSIGDILYYVDSNDNLVEIGEITAKSTQSLTVGTIVNTPSVGDFIAYVKSSSVESYGARGYYAEVKLTNDSVDEVELFEVSSNVFKSNP